MNGYQNMMQQPQGGVPIMPSGTPQITPELQSMVQREMQNPTGLMPLPQLYALNSLIQRLKNSAPVQQPQTNVAQDLAATADQMLGHGQQQQPPQMMAQGQPAPEETQMMAHGGIAGLPSYNFMPENYAHGGIVAFSGKDDDQEVEEGATPERVGKAALVPATAYGLKKLLDSKMVEKLARAKQSQALGPYYAPDPPTTSARVSALSGAVERGIKGSRFTPAFPKTLGAAAGPAAALAATAPTVYGTSTEDYEKRFGFDPGEGEGLSRLGRDIAVRGLGAASDLGNTLTLGMAGDLFRDRQAAKRAPTPAAPTTSKATDAEKAAEASLDDRVRNYMNTIGAGAGGEGRRGSGTATPTDSATTTVSPHQKDLDSALARQQTELADAKKRAEALKPADRSVFEATEEERYKKAGIGKAAEAEQARLDARQKGLETENKAAFWNDLAKAGFKMASRAGARGKDAINFFGALAAGGEDFSESNIKTASKFQALREDLAEKQSKLAVANEAVKMNRMDKADALYKDAQREYSAAQKDVLNFGTRMTDNEVNAHRALLTAEEAHKRAVEVENLRAKHHMQAVQANLGKDPAGQMLSTAYAAALKQNDTAAMKRINELQAARTASTIGFGAATKAASAEDIVYRKNPFVMAYAATKPGSKEREEAAQRLRSQGLSLPDEGMGGGSGNGKVVNFSDL